MDLCSYGGDDGGVGEGGIMAEMMEKGQHMRCRAAPAAGGGAGGEALPLSPLPPWLLRAVDEPSPMEMRLCVAAQKLGFSSPYICLRDDLWPSDG